MTCDIKRTGQQLSKCYLLSPPASCSPSNTLGVASPVSNRLTNDCLQIEWALTAYEAVRRVSAFYITVLTLHVRELGL